MASQRLIVGLERPFIRDLKEEIGEKQNLGVDYFVAPLFHPRFRRDSHGISDARLGATTRSDRELESRVWITNIVGKISEWIDLDSPDASARKSSLKAFQQEASWASHLSLQAILLPTPRIDSTHYAHAIMRAFTGYQQYYIRIPMVPAPSMHFQCPHSNNAGLCKDGWLVWDSLRQHFGDYHRHFVALELSADCEDIPNDEVGDQWVRRWCAEPVKLLLLPTSLFVNNHAGYPVLSKRIQTILAVLLPHCHQIVLTGQSHRECGSYLHYVQYLHHLTAQRQTQMSAAERHVQGYEDTLQAPLQPLMDNLEAQTYETFERDPMKYIRYEEAMVAAIRHLSSGWNEGGGTREDGTEMADGQNEMSSAGTPRTLVLTVVGAGRGPLVAAALSASATTNIPLRIYAVEKNCNAVITLRNRALTERWDNVTVIATDMRDWQPAELCDIMVSELLGSFGDNELSPECLDGAQKCLRPGGISIPQSYTSYLAPIATQKLWNMAKSFNLSNSTITDGLNTAYVVRFHAAFQFAEAKPLFTFVHPNIPSDEDGDKIDNTRYGCLSFVSQVDMVLHGLAGYFETVLFAPPPSTATSAGRASTATADGSAQLVGAGPAAPPLPPPPGFVCTGSGDGGSGSSNSETSRAASVSAPSPSAPPTAATAASVVSKSAAPVTLSTVPQTHTPDMYSWFPLFIPLSQPVRIQAGDTITAHVWRCVDAKKVWYEWCLSSPQRTPVQNSGGKSYSVGL